MPHTLRTRNGWIYNSPEHIITFATDFFVCLKTSNPILCYCKKNGKKALLKANQSFPEFLQLLLTKYLSKYLILVGVCSNDKTIRMTLYEIYCCWDDLFVQKQAPQYCFTAKRMARNHSWKQISHFRNFRNSY